MEDADLEKAAELAVLDATKNSGQRCTAVKRILCVEAVADKFAEQVLKRAKKLKCGDPMDPSVDVGTVIHEDAAKEFERRVEAAVRDGARLLHGNTGVLTRRQGETPVPQELRAAPPLAQAWSKPVLRRK
jgi:phosphonoacetaldehyde dehydrogenase